MRKQPRVLTVAESYEHNYLQSELEQTQNALESAYSVFQNVTDPDLIDSSIYEINAIQIRYKFLLEKAKSFSLKEKNGFRVRP
ncbi:MAG: YaaL family protein [Lachnospiraceae bacterium]|nr:YaaL family protein [Lachnospiraceae bacterium]